MIRIQGLNKFFNKGKQNEIHVLNKIDLELPDRGMVAIFGQSGCGKTTLLNTIGGLDRFDGGDIFIDGQSVKKNTDELRNRLIGYIFQNYNLNKNETCFENVANALRLCGISDERELEARVMAALSNVDMARYRARTPDTLSGGQQQRIAIARAIVKNPRIILADEPTGNLDEANTVMIMDLLRAIAQEHLVILITHEANLVDYYCDRVIELRDGAVVGVRENTASGYTTRDKNDIFLGELERSVVSDRFAEVEYFGTTPDEPLRLRIVNDGGRLYVQIRTEKVRVLDESSEVRLREGVFEEKKRAEEQSARFDMSRLPPVENGQYGKLFTLRSSIKSGFRANFSKRKKGKKLLLTCMVLFSAVLVLLSAIFGTAFDKLIDAKNSYNHNVFYVYTPDAAVSDKLNAALNDPSAAIDAMHLYEGWYPTGDERVSFVTGFFETFQNFSPLSANAVMLERSLVKDAKLLAGKKDGLAHTDLLISSATADRLLEESSLGYLKTYDDLIGLVTTGYYVDGQNLCIAGVVESDEPAIYPSDRALAQSALRRRGLSLSTPDAYGTTVAEGEAIFVAPPMLPGVTHANLPTVNSTVKINGVPLRVSKVWRIYTDYDEWCRANGIEPPDMEDWGKQRLSALYPDLVPDTDPYYQALSHILEESYYEYQLEVHYLHLDTFLTEYIKLSSGSIEAWLYVEKNVSEAKYMFMQDQDELYFAAKYHAENGSYPQRHSISFDKEQSLHEVLQRYHNAYSDEYYQKFQSRREGACYIVNDADYSRIAMRIGETHPSALKGSFYTKETVIIGGSMGTVGSSNSPYTTLHSSNPAATEAFLTQAFPDLSTGIDGQPAILSPSHLYKQIISDQIGTIISQLVAMASLLALLCICMYFIMRASLLSRIKEIGIYRAIGVTRQNLVRRFLVESLVLATLTVLVGFIGSSLLLRFWISLTPLMSSLFFYPIWLAAILLLLLYAVCLICGTAPILLLLRKTPSEILAKYDI